MIDYVKRLAGPFTTEGQTQLPFSFLIFEPTDVYVARSDRTDGIPTHLVYGADFSVLMNPDQIATPGGTVVLSKAIAGGQVVVVGSAVAYTQNVQLTNYSRFPPEILNTALDRIVVQIQQIVEMTGRVLSVPVTSDSTPEQMIERLLSAQNEAKQFANESRESAESVAETARQIFDTKDGVVAQVVAAGAEQIEQVTSEGTAQYDRVREEGDRQYDRIEAAADQVIQGYGLSAAREVWTLTDATSSGSEINLPNGMKYLVGHHQMQVAWNGLVLRIGSNWEELGTSGQPSSKFKILFDLKAGDELEAWAIPLGRGDVTDAITQIATVSDGLAELSQKVVYKSAEAAQS